MEKLINKIIDEKFASKAQQRYFYAQANKGGKKGKKWAKWAKEFSSDTDFKKLPEKKKEVDEIVDELGNIARGEEPTNFATKYITSISDTDTAVQTMAGAMGNHAVGPFGRGIMAPSMNSPVKYWGESKQLTKKQVIEIALNKALGADETILKDVDYDEAKDHMEDELGLPDREAEERLEKMGYDENLPDDKVRLIEKQRNYIEEFIESIISKKKEDGEFVKGNTEKEVKEVSPIVKRQLKSLNDSLKSHGLSFEDVMEYLKNNE